MLNLWSALWKGHFKGSPQNYPSLQGNSYFQTALDQDGWIYILFSSCVEPSIFFSCWPTFVSALVPQLFTCRFSFYSSGRAAKDLQTHNTSTFKLPICTTACWTRISCSTDWIDWFNFWSRSVVEEDITLKSPSTSLSPMATVSGRHQRQHFPVVLSRPFWNSFHVSFNVNSWLCLPFF